VVEYFGPLILYPIFFLQPTCIYGDAVNSTPSCLQKLALFCWTFHYLKRELETLFVHKFSHSTMPSSNLIKNCSYYWGNAALVAYFVNHPLHTPPSEKVIYVTFASFLLCEIGNLITHIMLRNLRNTSSERSIPRGFLFEYVSVPNYTFEIWAWLAFAIMTQTLTAYLFMILGAFQMIVWAQQKHKTYLKDLNYPRNRKIIFPLIY